MTETSSENSLPPEDSQIVTVTSEPGQALAEEPAENPTLKPVVRAIQRLEDVIDTETRLLLRAAIRIWRKSTPARAVGFTISTRRSRKRPVLPNRRR